MDNIITIAEGLTAVQRDLLLNRLSEDWADVPNLRTVGDSNALRGWASEKIGLLESRSGHDFYQVRLSPLGKAVRSYLQRQST